MRETTVKCWLAVRSTLILKHGYGKVVSKLCDHFTNLWGRICYFLFPSFPLSSSWLFSLVFFSLAFVSSFAHNSYTVYGKQIFQVYCLLHATVTISLLVVFPFAIFALVIKIQHKLCRFIFHFKICENTTKKTIFSVLCVVFALQNKHKKRKKALKIMLKRNKFWEGLKKKWINEKKNKQKTI